MKLINIKARYRCKNCDVIFNVDGGVFGEIILFKGSNHILNMFPHTVTHNCHGQDKFACIADLVGYVWSPQDD